MTFAPHYDAGCLCAAGQRFLGAGQASIADIPLVIRRAGSLRKADEGMSGSSVRGCYYPTAVVAICLRSESGRISVQASLT
jgi:hypothetical protein